MYASVDLVTIGSDNIFNGHSPRPSTGDSSGRACVDHYTYSYFIHTFYIFFRRQVIMPTEFRMTSRHLSGAETVTDVMQRFGANQIMHVAIIRASAPITESLLHDALQVGKIRGPGFRS